MFCVSYLRSISSVYIVHNVLIYIFVLTRDGASVLLEEWIYHLFIFVMQEFNLDVRSQFSTSFWNLYMQTGMSNTIPQTTHLSVHRLFNPFSTGHKSMCVSSFEHVDNNQDLFKFWSTLFIILSKPWRHVFLCWWC